MNAGEAIGRPLCIVSDGHILFVCAKRIWKEKRTKEGTRPLCPLLGISPIQPNVQRFKAPPAQIGTGGR